MINTESDLNDELLKQSIEENTLNRNSKLVIMSKLLANLNKNVTISIDGRWGTGKTYFVKQFKYIVEHIENYNDNKIFTAEEKVAFNKIHNSSLVIYYNAWENDSHANALESLIYNILNEYPNMKNQVVDFKDFKKVFKKISRDIIYKGTLELLDINNFDDLNSFEDLSKEITTIEEKKKSFNQLIDCILGEKNRLILMIDELDRCKPSFAIELLETIKHFYNNDKVTVIVSTNNYELSNTIRNYYGNDFDGYGYLNKFYDSIISLDRINIKKYLQMKYNFCTRTWAWHDFSYLVMIHFNFSLRECNRYVSLYNMLISYIENDRKYFEDRNYIHTCILMPIVLALKIKDIDKYNLFINKEGEQIIVDFLDKSVSNDEKYVSWIKELCMVSTDGDYKQKILETYYEVFDNEYKYYKFPFFDAISMLGTDLLISNISDDKLTE